MRQHAAIAYRNQQVGTASSAELIGMLYDGALGSIQSGREAIDSRRVADVHDHLIRAQAIVTELRCSLNLDIDLAQHLDSVYAWAHERLVQANLRRDPRLLVEVDGLIRPLRDAWKQSCIDGAVGEAGEPLPSTAATG